MRRRLLLHCIFALICLRLLLSALPDTPGLRYEYHTIHILEVDPHRLRIEAVRAMSDGVGCETVASIAQRSSAIAAVNAGFFRIALRFDGEPERILKKEVTELLLSVDGADTLNLDGGGSSTLYLQGKVVKSPVDTARESPVSDAIFVRRKQPCVGSPIAVPACEP